LQTCGLLLRTFLVFGSSSPDAIGTPRAGGDESNGDYCRCGHPYVIDQALLKPDNALNAENFAQARSSIIGRERPGLRFGVERHSFVVKRNQRRSKSSNRLQGQIMSFRRDAGPFGDKAGDFVVGG